MAVELSANGKSTIYHFSQYSYLSKTTIEGGETLSQILKVKAIRARKVSSNKRNKGNVSTNQFKSTKPDPRTSLDN